MVFDSFRVRVRSLTRKRAPLQSSTPPSGPAKTSETPSAEPEPSTSKPVFGQLSGKPAVQHESSVAEPVSVAASTQTSPNVSQQPNDSEDAPKSFNESDLWLRAYMKLQEQQPELIKAYNTHLASLQHDQENRGGIQNERSVKSVVNQLLDDREKKQYRVPLLKKDVKIRDQVEKVARFVLWFDPIVKSAVSTQPYAALAWSGASLLLPLLTSGSTENEAMLNGFNSLSDVQLYWQICEENYLNKKGLEKKDLNYEQLLECLVKLYTLIFEYQALVICHLSKTQRSRAWADITKSTDWVAKITEISKLSDEYSKLIDRYEATKISQIRDSKLEQLNYSRRILENLRDLVEATSKQSQANNQDKYERALLQDLAPRDGGWEDHKNINPAKVTGTCEWFFKDDRFREWRNSSTSSILWVSASPGCGKSVLSRALVDEQHLYRSVTTTVCYFFFKDGTESRMHATDALSAILHQLFEHDTENQLIKFALPSHRANGQKLTTNFSELWQILMKCVESPNTGEIVILLDALDECKSESWKSLLEKLVKFYSQRPSDQHSKLKFLITSRPYDDIELQFRGFFKVSTYFAFDADENSSDIGKDIDRVIDAKMKNDTIFEENDRLLIANRLKSMRQRTYLWLHLTFNIIQESPSSFEQWADLEELLSNLPQKVSDAYEKILSRSKDEEHTVALLQIMLAATRPLTLVEANRALTLAVKPNKCDSYTTLVSHGWHEERFQKKVKNLCGLFISVYDSKLFFIHQTAREFLIHRPQQAKWGGRLEMTNAHAEMTHVCLRYLSCLGESELELIEESRRGLSPYTIFEEIEELERKIPLALYSAQHWMEHAKHSENEKVIQDRIMNFLLPQGLSYFIWVRLYLRYSWDDIPFTDYDQQGPLYYVSLAGLQNTVRLLLQQEIYVDAEKNAINKALRATSMNGHVGVAQLLIENGADFRDWRAMYYASQSGRINIVQLLIEKGADVNAQDNGSAICAASQYGHIDIVQLLVEKGADINAQDSRNGSAICAASESGHIDIVRLLIEKGADLNSQGSQCRYAICSASASGHIDIVQLLIERGADVNAQDSYRVSAIQAASARGHIDVMELLLKNGAYVNAQGPNCLTPLLAASQKNALQILLENGAHVNSANGRISGYNALIAASERGYKDIVQLLLDNGADVNSNDGYHNALFRAAEWGDIESMQLLFDYGANFCPPNNLPEQDLPLDPTVEYYSNALDAASRQGHEGIVRLLLERGAIWPDESSRSDFSADDPSVHDSGSP